MFLALGCAQVEMSLFEVQFHKYHLHSFRTDFAFEVYVLCHLLTKVFLQRPPKIHLAFSLPSF